MTKIKKKKPKRKKGNHKLNQKILTYFKKDKLKVAKVEKLIQK
jgi:hypothetical protein